MLWVVKNQLNHLNQFFSLKHIKKPLQSKIFGNHRVSGERTCGWPLNKNTVTY